MRSERRRISERFAPTRPTEIDKNQQSDEDGERNRMRKSAMPFFVARRKNEYEIQIGQIRQDRSDKKRNEKAKLERFFDYRGDKTRAEQSVCNR
jgi:hypothetical protein